MSLLELENVVTAYGKVEALKGLTLRVEQGEIVALLGSNGAGKSTTLRTISGLIRPRSGRMRFLGQPIDRLSPEAIVKLGVAHVPENRRVFPGLTVRERIFSLVVRIACEHHVVSLRLTQSKYLLSFPS
jgi:branched-chain amino acid transport system ATP-binding protein